MIRPAVAADRPLADAAWTVLALGAGHRAAAPRSPRSRTFPQALCRPPSAVATSHRPRRAFGC